jgi:hypothetical protein
LVGPSYPKVCKVFEGKDLSLDFGSDLSAEARPGMAGLRQLSMIQG